VDCWWGRGGVAGALWGPQLLGLRSAKLGFGWYFIVVLFLPLLTDWHSAFCDSVRFGPLGRCLVYKSGFLLGSSYQLNPAQRTAHTRVCKKQNPKNPNNGILQSE